MLQIKKKSKGFTLIELIMVIVLLGILAATALPKFADMSSDAEQAVLEGISGSFAAAVNIAHAQYLVNPNTNPVELEGAEVYMSSDGWPEDSIAIVSAGDMSVGNKCSNLLSELLNLNTNGSVSSASGLGSVCTFTGTGGSFTYDVTTGVVNYSLPAGP